MQIETLKPILEALFAASDKPLSVVQLFDLFAGDLDRPDKDEIRQAIQELVQKYEGSGMELKQVASGFRFQVRADYELWIARLWEQKPPRYSRALMETLALIAYRQPITRGEIEDIRGVSVSSNIIKTLQEREWVKPLGHKEVPGRPTLYGTTRAFLDYFNLKSLNELPTLSEIRDLDQFSPEFPFDEAAQIAEDSETVPVAAGAWTPVSEPGRVPAMSQGDAADPAEAADEIEAQGSEIEVDDEPEAVAN
jgi:segregation and condensation protein B